MADVINFAGEVSLSRGLEPIIRKLRILSKADQSKGMRKAMRAGSNVIRKSAAAKAKNIDDPKTKERIYANIAVQYASRSSRRLNAIVMRIGVRGGARFYGNTRENVRKGRVGKSYKVLGDSSNPGGDTWYWRFLEFGIPSRGIKKQSFMLPALDEKAQEATDVIARQLESYVTQIMISEKL